MSDRGPAVCEDELDAEVGWPASSAVLVGVDGGPASLSAVDWATEEARLRKVPLKILYVLRGDQTTRGAEEVLRDAVRVARSLWAEGDIITAAYSGDTVRGLVHESRAAALLVVGLDLRRPRGSHGILGSVEDRVAAQSDCPVVWVPQGVRAPKLPAVLVLVKPDDSAATVTKAAREADLRAAELIVGGLDRGPEATPEFVERTLLDIEQYYPGLPVTFLAAGVDTARGLEQTIGDLYAAGRLELVVVGIAHSDTPGSLRSSDWGPGLARQLPVPVMYVPRPVTAAPTTALPLAPSTMDHPGGDGG